MQIPESRRLSQPHLLGVADLSLADVELILARADRFADLNADHQPPPVRSLHNKTMINLFFENSTRTQASFELAAKRLGATTMNMAVARSSVAKGETLVDTTTTLNAMLPDMLVVRHHASGAVRLLSERVNCAVINAGDGRCEHPTQALLDALTMRRAFRRRRGPDSAAARLEGLTIAICGDVAHSRVARSNILLQRLYGSEIRVFGPPSLTPEPIEAMGARRARSMKEAVSGADVVMMLRLQRERMAGAHISSLREYFHVYGLDEDELRHAAPDALVMHPGPMNRGVEIGGELADDSDRSVISAQVEMGVAVRMAVLDLLAENPPHRAPRRQRRSDAPDGRFAPAAPAGAAAAPAPGEPGGRPLALLDALIVDPDAAAPTLGGLLLRDGLIAGRIGPGEAPPSEAAVERLGGAALGPGLVDMRVFIGEPGARHRESVASGGEAAAAGGVTTFVMQPSTNPPVDDPSMLDFLNKRARDEAVDHAMPRLKVMAALTKRLEGLELSEHLFLKEADAVALTDGGRPIANPLVLLRALESAAALDMLVATETQDPHLTAHTCATEGAVAFRLGLPAAPALAERMAVDRDLALASLARARWHAAQISTGAAAEAIARAKDQGLDVSAAAAATHLLLDEGDIGAYRTFLKLDPPLRAAEDRDALVAALRSGAVDCIVSSHGPQSEESKRVPFEEAAPGGVGLETLLSAGLEIAARADVSLCRLFAWVSANPARRLRLASGRLSPGAPADLVVFDPVAPRLINRRSLRSKSKNTPFDHLALRGRVLRTIVAGRTIYTAFSAGEPSA